MWAKSDPFHPLPCHLIDVGAVAVALLEAEAFRTTATRFAVATGCPEERVRPWLAYLVSLHDLGKCHRRFQAKAQDDRLLAPLRGAGLIREPCYDSFRHEVVSADWVRQYLHTVGNWQMPSARTVAAALRAHHGNFRAEEDKAEVGEAEKAQWEPLREQLASVLWDLFQPGHWAANFQDHSVAGVLLSGLLVLSDWIASNPDLFFNSFMEESLDQYAARSHDVARKAIRRLGFDGSSRWKPGQTFRDVWPHIAEANGLQSRVEALAMAGVHPGLAIIEAPMGEGKTEAAVYLATRWMVASGQTGLYVALPTAASSNQMHGRITQFMAFHDPLAAAATRLVHGSAWLLDEATPIRLPELHGAGDTDDGLALDWFRPAKRTLLALNGVGTVDQAHMSVLNVRFGFLRLFGLAGKVLIIDEVHAYDAYMSEFLEHLLRWCRALTVPVILLSATLPAKKRQALIEAYAPGARQPSGQSPYPLITIVGPDGRVRPESDFETSLRPSVRLIKHHGYLGDEQRIATLVADRARTGGCIGVIASTVTSAQAIFRAVYAELKDHPIEVMLFHARFTAERREELERAVLERLDKRSVDPNAPDYRPRPESFVLVATQVVEQSLDLDFDEMFTELAPIDLLLQRMGRLWRHIKRKDRKGRNTPDFHLFLPESAGGSLKPASDVYSSYVLRTTHVTLVDRDLITLPGDLRELVGKVYDDVPSTDSPWWNEWQRLQVESKLSGDAAVNYLIPDPELKVFSLANMYERSRDENDEGTASYFAVRTRQGDYTRSVLALEGEAFRHDLSRIRPGGREELKALFRKAVSLPAWWLNKVEAAPGYEAPERAPDWLPGHNVLRFKSGRWEGITDKGVPFAIVNDHLLGFVRVERKGV